MSLGIILLVLASLVVLFGLAEQVLDRLYLNDKQALLVIGGMVVGSFIDIPLYRGTPGISVNLGGAIIPLGLAIYVLARAGTAKELSRGILGAVLAGLAVYGVSKLYDFDTYIGFIDPQYLWGILAGGIAYVIGRSRRLAFISGVLGIILADIGHIIETFARGFRPPAGSGAAASLIRWSLPRSLACSWRNSSGKAGNGCKVGPPLSSGSIRRDWMDRANRKKEGNPIETTGNHPFHIGFLAGRRRTSQGRRRTGGTLLYHD